MWALRLSSQIIAAANRLLGNDKQLDVNATGEDLREAIDSLPLEDQAELLRQRFDSRELETRESYATLRAMIERDAQNPHSTRPFIAKGAFLVVSFVVVVAVICWAYGVLTSNVVIVTAVMSGWQFILAIIGPLVTLLWSYFGVLRKENKNKLDAANGVSVPEGVVSTIAGLFGRK